MRMEEAAVDAVEVSDLGSIADVDHQLCENDDTALDSTVVECGLDHDVSDLDDDSKLTSFLLDVGENQHGYTDADCDEKISLVMEVGREENVFHAELSTLNSNECGVDDDDEQRNEHHLSVVAVEPGEICGDGGISDFTAREECNTRIINASNVGLQQEQQHQTNTETGGFVETEENDAAAIGRAAAAGAGEVAAEAGLEERTASEGGSKRSRKRKTEACSSRSVQEEHEQRQQRQTSEARPCVAGASGAVARAMQRAEDFANNSLGEKKIEWNIMRRRAGLEVVEETEEEEDDDDGNAEEKKRRKKNGPDVEGANSKEDAEDKRNSKKYKRRLQKNRDSAYVSRIRRRCYTKFLEESLNEEETQKLQLQRRVDMLEEQLEQLKHSFGAPIGASSPSSASQLRAAPVAPASSSATAAMGAATTQQPNPNSTASTPSSSVRSLEEIDKDAAGFVSVLRTPVIRMTRSTQASLARGLRRIFAPSVMQLKLSSLPAAPAWTPPPASARGRSGRARGFSAMMAVFLFMLLITSAFPSNAARRSMPSARVSLEEHMPENAPAQVCQRMGAVELKQSAAEWSLLRGGELFDVLRKYSALGSSPGPLQTRSTDARRNVDECMVGAGEASWQCASSSSFTSSASMSRLLVLALSLLIGSSSFGRDSGKIIRPRTRNAPTVA